MQESMSLSMGNDDENWPKIDANSKTDTIILTKVN